MGHLPELLLSSSQELVDFLTGFVPLFKTFRIVEPMGLMRNLFCKKLLYLVQIGLCFFVGEVSLVELLYPENKQILELLAFQELSEE